MALTTLDRTVAGAPSNVERANDAPPQVKPAREGRQFSALARLADYIPTLAVVALLAGVGAYGHYAGWKLPKFSALAGNGMVERNDWCETHAVHESQCVECRPELLPKGKDHGWCKEHGVHGCPWCHPDVAQLKPTPTIAEADRGRTVAAHRAVAPAGPENNAVCKNYRRRIQFASLEAVKKAGLDVGLVDRQPIVERIAANGEITYDQTRFASLASRLPGTAWRVEKNVGDRVRKDDVLALVEAAEVGRAKAELLQALSEEHLQSKAVGRLNPASSDGVVPGRQLEKAQAEHAQAQARLLSAQQALVNLGLPVHIEELRGMPQEKLADHLRLLGVPAAAVTSPRPDSTTSNLLPLKAPMDGAIVARHATAGEVVDTSRVLFQMADTDRMWLTVNVPLEEARKLVLGQAVRFRPDGSHAEVAGSLSWISTTVDQQTRMVAARAEVPNPQGHLRHGTFGTGYVILREEPEAIAVPNEAVHWEGCCHVVFVRDKGYFDGPDSPKVFHVRTVRLGTRTERFMEIVAGVLPGEVVATKGSDVLRAELLKNNLGEGCCGAK
jgi:multidrug efflux pump subunit AcrA (membrane-fusion protein)